MMFNKKLGIDDWSVEQMDYCIQMAQVQTSQSLVQLINMYVMADESWVTLESDLALRKISEIFNGGLECVLLDDFNLHHLF